MSSEANCCDCALCQKLIQSKSNLSGLIKDLEEDTAGDLLTKPISRDEYDNAIRTLYGENTTQVEYDAFYKRNHDNGKLTFYI